MPTFIVPYNGELRIEAESAEEALAKAYDWRRFVMQYVSKHLEELHLEKVSMKPMPEVTEVNADWLANQQMRSKFRTEWEYTSYQVPVRDGSKVFFTHRVAIGPVFRQVNAGDVQPEYS